MTSDSDQALEDFLCERDLLGGPMTVRRRLGAGRSNITELISDGTRSVVVRRPPPSPIPPGGYDVLREARIQRALESSAVPVPRTLAIDAGGVLGEAFFVMEMLEGVVATTQTPEGLRGDALADALVGALAVLHAIDPASVGLGAHAEPTSDLGSHLKRFAQIVDPLEQGLDDDLGELLELLLAGAPGPRAARIIHGDYRLGNVMLAPDRPERLLAILDWELATTGDPLRDVGYFLATYASAGEPLHALTKMSTATLEPGWPSRAELAERYAAAAGTNLDDIDWYTAMAQWKLAVLFAHQRHRAGEGIGDDVQVIPGLVEEFLDAAHRTLRGY